ncbi:UDP-2,4-diacetamido-2,4,6-trideoxy-beta-L-altropyranose hydrolase [Variovorax paradoxus]|nr:UDP-2,4-diacetamido-2,4,6-trideoxy-beta-L-altropyranose hydrolase [Variovorax paradoxus]MBT2300800.1 UDP-2,4-diacetamido-2,4,6-trideoxy-beta-L-altropyranose hydrolase [Variovorax paradoxus]
MTGLAGATVVFRADASLQIGTGHVMRCLTLAAALRLEGADCRFVCRGHPGHLANLIRDRGFAVTVLPMGTLDPSRLAVAAHDAWLGCDWNSDAAQTIAALQGIRPDWIVVDHYALEAGWEQALAAHAGAMLVIDDLADRDHRCELLLDQNVGRDGAHYAGRVSAGCEVLAGPRYALLRPEFAAMRAYSLERRRDMHVQHLLISLGGVDQANVTGALLEALRACALPADLRICVVMGSAAPWLAEVQDVAARMPWPTQVRANVQDMALLMADSDLALGAAGATSWERCCLGLPSIVVALAANQRGILKALHEAGAAAALADRQDGAGPDLAALPHLLQSAMVPSTLRRLSTTAERIVDGLGTGRVLAAIAHHEVQP